MDPRHISLQEIEPFIRFSQDVYIPGNTKALTVTAYDHRLFYVISGQGSLELGDVSHELSAGVVLYWMSGTAYRIQAAPESVLHIISVNFDFTSQHTDVVQYLPMVQPQDFIPANCIEKLLFCDAERLNESIILHDLPEILPSLQAMLQEAASGKSFQSFQLSNLMRTILVQLYRAAVQRPPLRSSGIAAGSILDYVHSHYVEDLTNKLLAERFNYHPNYISQLIAEQTGTPLHQYLIKLRINQALYLLQTTELPINEIARKVGYKNTSYFSQYFKQCTGHTPKEFRVK